MIKIQTNTFAIRLEENGGDVQCVPISALKVQFEVYIFFSEWTFFSILGLPSNLLVDSLNLTVWLVDGWIAWFSYRVFGYSFDSYKLYICFVW